MKYENVTIRFHYLHQKPIMKDKDGIISQEEYLKENGNICLFCQGSNLYVGNFIHNNKGYLQRWVFCNECRGEWTDVYKLIKYKRIIY